MKFTFAIGNSSKHLYVSLQPLFTNLQYTFNALAGTNRLNQSSLNVIDCRKLQH